MSDSVESPSGRASLESEWTLRNRTPWPVWVEGDDRVLSLAPLEERAVAEDPCAVFPLTRLVDRRQVEVAPACGAGADPRGRTLRRLARRSQQWATMSVVVAVGVVLPAAAISFGTDLHTQVSLDLPHVRVEEPLELIGRLLQLTMIAVASLLPALLYFQFDAERLSTLRARWLANAFRLDPTVSTVADVEAKYGPQIEEAYGRPGEGGGRLFRGRRSPLVVATLTLTFGWLLILLNAGDSVVPVEGAATGELTFSRLLDPDPTVVTFAFLGAYFFALSLVARGYARGDLRPKTYNAVTVRVLLVVILAWLLSVMWPGVEHQQWLYALAFLTGFVPETTVHLVAERLDRVLQRDGRQGWASGLGDADDLRQLEGIDLYERTRLAEEGIASVQALAHHDLVDLFFKTRIPAPRLVDWVDQAVLHLHIGEHVGRGDVSQAVRRLRGLGIRTASDLVSELPEEQPTSERSCLLRSELAERRRRKLAEALCPNVDADDSDTRLSLLVRAVRRGEWVDRIAHWRDSDLVAVPPERRRWLDAHGDLHEGDPRFSRAAERALPRARDGEIDVREEARAQDGTGR